MRLAIVDGHAAAVETLVAGDWPTVPGLRWLRYAAFAATLTGAVGALVLVSTVRWLQVGIDHSRPAVAAIEPYQGWQDVTPVVVTIGGRKGDWLTTADELRSGVEMWRRMHLSDWATVSEPVRLDALDRMVETFRHVLVDPNVWDGMTTFDWDDVPQPVRTLAYRNMVAYWSGFYGVGRRYGLPPRLVSDTLAAIVMSESWFDHRGLFLNRHGNRDLGLGAASDFARERMRALYRAGVVDISPSDDDYLNPWIATRFVALWISVLLDESDGDLDLAVRAYHRGTAAAHDRLGTAYLDTVRSRLWRYIRNLDAPPAWSDLWHRGRALEKEAWPWLGRPTAGRH